ncbi:MAG: hypothetical protein FJX76_08930 [Armatimonadetes bacterium]|nr:hypothetical protein [Armatimonadota bacterium]
MLTDHDASTLGLLEACSEALSPTQLEDLRGLTRHRAVAVWEPACRLLGARAGGEAAAHALLFELLESPLPELRLRGVTALGALAREGSEDARAFVDAALRSSVDHPDPVLLESVMALLPGLPDEAARALLVDCLFDACDAVRAAAAASLSKWTPRPPKMLARLADDTSPLVRGAFVGALVEMAPDEETGTAWELLAAAPEPYFRALVADELRARFPEEDWARPLITRLAEDADPLVASAARGELPAEEVPGSRDAAGFSALQRMEERLYDAPDAALDVLRDCSREALGSLAHLARDRSVCALCSGLLALTDPEQMKAEVRLGHCAQALAESTTPFARFVAECARAVAARSTADVVCWASRAQVDSALSHGLAQLVEVADILGEGAGTGTLSEATLALEEAGRRISEEFDAPERTVMKIVVDAWGEMLDNEIESAISGVES